MERTTRVGAWALVLCIALLSSVATAEATNSLQVASRVGQQDEPGLIIPVNGEWENDLLGYTISLQFDPAFIEVTDLNLAGTKADGAKYFVPQWNNEAGYFTAEVIMGTEYPEDFGLSIPAGSGSLLNIVVNVKHDAPSGQSTTLDLRDDLGIPPRQNRFFWNNGSVVSPDQTDGLLRTVFILPTNFEANDGGLVGGGGWRWGHDRSDTTNHLWGDVLVGSYPPSACDALEGNFIVPEGYGSGYLTFSHKYNINMGLGKGDLAYDGGNVQTLVSTWIVLQPDWSGYSKAQILNQCLNSQPGYTGASSGWATHMVIAAFDLSGYLRPLKGDMSGSYDIRWLFGSDEWQQTVADGWFIDNVCLYAAPTECGPFFIRGDINKDGIVDIGDVTYLNNYLFISGPPPPPPCDRADVNDDGNVNISDVVYLINYLFTSGPVPPWPCPNIGIDPTPDNLALACPGGGRGEGGELGGDALLSPGGGKASAPVPDHFSLSQNSPNPFGKMTEIRYDLPRACHVRLEVYNPLGQKVATMVDADQDAGSKALTWDASSLSDGIYFYKLQAGDFTAQSKMIVLRAR